MRKGMLGALENGTLITGLLAVLLVGGAITLTIMGKPVPDWMIVSVATIIGAFFGSSTAPKQFRREDADRIQSALFETLPPHTKLEQMQAEYKKELERRKPHGK